MDRPDNSMQFGFMVLITPPASFEAWVESASQKALADQLSIFEEERFLIANQPAHRLSLVSGSGGIIHRVLTDLSGRYFEINIEGNYNLAKAVLDSIQPIASGGLKPPDSETPAAGICGEAQGDPVSIVLGIGPDGIPFAGRCTIITPWQRIKLINQSNEPLGPGISCNSSVLQGSDELDGRSSENQPAPGDRGWPGWALVFRPSRDPRARA